MKTEPSRDSFLPGQCLENVRHVLDYFDSLGVGKINLRTRKDSLDELQRSIDTCMKCKLSSHRSRIVFGVGNPYADLMFIGEAPGREEDVQGIPFVGEAGMLLSRLIERMGFSREDVYIANVVKCRPPMNRDPEKDEIEMCRTVLEEQIATIRPKIIITLGRIAIQSLLRDDSLKITSIRGNFMKFRNIPVMPTFHPAYLLRNPKDKWLTWNDAQKVLERLRV